MAGRHPENRNEKKVSRLLHRMIGLILLDFHDKATIEDAVGVLESHAKVAQAMARWKEKDSFLLAKRILEDIEPYFSPGWHRRAEMDKRKADKKRKST